MFPSLPFYFSQTNKAEGKKNLSWGDHLLLSITSVKARLWEEDTGEEGEMQQVEQPAETSVRPSKVGVLFSSQRVISFSTDAELNSACVRALIFLLKHWSYI